MSSTTRDDRFDGVYQKGATHQPLAAILYGNLTLNFQAHLPEEPLTDRSDGSSWIARQDKKPCLTFWETYGEFKRRARELGFPIPQEGATTVTHFFCPKPIQQLALQASELRGEVQDLQRRIPHDEFR